MWSDPQIAKSIEDSIRTGLNRLNVDWEQDIAPWLGDEIGLGISNISLAPNAPSSTPASVAMVIATRDTAKSDALLAKLRVKLQSNGVKLDDQTYRNVATVEQTAAGPGGGIAYATVNGLVIVANGSEELHGAVDATLDGKGLDKSSKYQATLSKLRGGRAATVYLNADALIKPILDSLKTGLSPAFLVLSSGLDAQGFGLGLTFQPNGLLAEFITSGSATTKLPVEEKTGSKAVSNPNRMLRAVPDTTLLYASGRRLSDAFSDLLTALKLLDPRSADSLGKFEREAGIDLQKDIISWMTGEAAFAVVPGAGLIGSGASPVDVALIVEAGDKQVAEAGTHKLIQALAAQSGGKVGDVTVGDNRLHALLDFGGNPSLVYGLIGDNFVLASSQSAARAIASAGSSPLADAKDFKEAVAPLPGNNIGYVYFKPKLLVDYLTVLSSLGNQKCDACTVLAPLRALAFTIEYPPSEPGAIRSALFMLLDTAKK